MTSLVCCCVIRPANGCLAHSLLAEIIFLYFDFFSNTNEKNEEKAHEKGKIHNNPPASEASRGVNFFLSY